MYPVASDGSVTGIYVCFHLALLRYFGGMLHEEIASFIILPVDCALRRVLLCISLLAIDEPCTIKGLLG